MYPYSWTLKGKDLEAVKKQIVEAKNMYRNCNSRFKAEWYTKHDKHVLNRLRDAVKGMRQYRNTIVQWYKEFPMPPYAMADFSYVRGEFIFWHMYFCPTCDCDFNEEEKPRRCPDCGQTLWWYDPLNDNLDRYENGVFDGVHRRLIQR